MATGLDRVGRLRDRQPARAPRGAGPRRDERDRDRVVRRLARRAPRGARGTGKLLALAGAGALGAGGWLGGHLAYAQGLGVDQTAFEAGPEDWTPALPDAELGEGALHRVDAGGVAVLVARVDGEVHAIANRCSHRGAPLDEGELDGGCVTCPWHGSVFRLADGGVERGPAAYPQPSWRVRVHDGDDRSGAARRVRLRPPMAGRDELLELLRPPAHRGPLIAAGRGRPDGGDRARRAAARRRAARASSTSSSSALAAALFLGLGLQAERDGGSAGAAAVGPARLRAAAALGRRCCGSPTCSARTSASSRPRRSCGRRWSSPRRRPTPRRAATRRSARCWPGSRPGSRCCRPRTGSSARTRRRPTAGCCSRSRSSSRSPRSSCAAGTRATRS